MCKSQAVGRGDCPTGGGFFTAVAVAVLCCRFGGERLMSVEGAGGSRPSKTNRQERHESLNGGDSDLVSSDLPDATGLRPLSVRDGVTLRDEAVVIATDDGMRVSIDGLPEENRPDGERKARSWYSVVNAWRDWMNSPIYRSGHIEFEGPDGGTARKQIENSYMESYSSRYYARLKDLERGVERRYDDVTTVMLTLSASNENANGGPRCPADHMREIAAGWNTARKQLPHILEGYNYCYARIWEPHKSGYGHQHIAIFIESDDDLEASSLCPTLSYPKDVCAEDFRPFMDSYTGEVPGAGSKAHSNAPCSEHDDGNGWNDAVGGCDDCRCPVSVNDDVENMGSYISEYLGIFGEEALNRPLTEQMFYATTWATNTRRLDFGHGAQEIISGEKFRRETGLKPSDRDGCESDSKPAHGGDTDGDGDGDTTEGWSAKRLCTVPSKTREHIDVSVGGVDVTTIDGSNCVDPPKWVD